MLCDPLVTKRDPLVIAGVFWGGGVSVRGSFCWWPCQPPIPFGGMFVLPASVTGLGSVRLWQVDCLLLALAFF